MEDFYIIHYKKNLRVVPILYADWLYEYILWSLTPASECLAYLWW